MKTPTGCTVNPLQASFAADLGGEKKAMLLKNDYNSAESQQRNTLQEPVLSTPTSTLVAWTEGLYPDFLNHKAKIPAESSCWRATFF